jgi:hypothetical protein
MEKIVNLLKQLGGSDELAKAVVKELTAWHESEKKALHEDYERKLEKAKAVNKYKADLARNVEIFLEAKVNTVNKEAQKQAAIGESEAARTLKDVKSLLEGVKIGLPDNIQVADENKKLRVKVGQVQEHNAKIEQSLRRSNMIAKNLLERVKQMEAGQASQTVAESKDKPQSLESLRIKAEQPKTTRPAIVETLPKKKDGEQVEADPEIAAIAESLDGSPALVITE